jgi:hypothetical protein
VLVGVADVAGADDEVEVDDDELEVVEVCDCDVWGPWKSTHDSVRTTLPAELTTRELELTV